MFDPPTTLSPSRVGAFTSCPLAFRFASIQKLPEPASLHTAKGTYVHRILELLFQAPPAERTRALARDAAAPAWAEVAGSDEVRRLNPSAEAVSALLADSEVLVDRYFTMEDPAAVEPLGLEMSLDAPLGGNGNGGGDGSESASAPLVLRGIIDRLERRADGALVVTDYKTGRAPSPAYEQRRLGGVHFYAWLCEQALGERPSEIRLMYLASGETISAYPSDQSIRFLPKRASAVYQAIRKACETGEFRPQPGPLCGSCAFQRWCPSFDGDPSLAALEAPQVYGLGAPPEVVPA